MNIYAKRRQKLVDSIEDNSIIIIFGSRERIRNNDVKYKFRQNSNFFYLIGLNEPNAISVLEKKNNQHKTIIFSNTSSKKEKIWDDNILGQPDIIKKFEVDYAFPIKSFEKKLYFFLKNSKNIFFSSENKKYYESYIYNILKKFDLKKKLIKNLNNYIYNERLLKDKHEISIIKKSNYISSKAHINVINRIKPNIMEYELESLFIKNCMDLGSNEQAYNPIFASGENACILHYIKNNNKLNPNKLILIDAGCEYKNYASDITRTYPINGIFSQEQKAIYEIVLHAQKEAIKNCIAGKTWDNINCIVIKLISEGLKYFNIIKEDPKAIIEKELYKNFYMHSPGHWLGLDVHDVGDYKNKKGWNKFKENMYLTIEPGIYINNNNLSVEKKWRGIGIRIEDNILITKKYNEILSKLVPKDIKDIENVFK